MRSCQVAKSAACKRANVLFNWRLFNLATHNELERRDFATFAARGVVLHGVQLTARHDSPFTEWQMLTIAVILLVLWLLGLVSSYTVGGLIHILLVAAIVIFLVRAFQGRRPIV